MRYCVEYKHKLLGQNWRTFQTVLMFCWAFTWLHAGITTVFPLFQPSSWSWDFMWFVPDKERLESKFEFSEWFNVLFVVLGSNKLYIYALNSMFCLFQSNLYDYQLLQFDARNCLTSLDTFLLVLFREYLWATALQLNHRMCLQKNCVGGLGRVLLKLVIEEIQKAIVGVSMYLLWKTVVVKSTPFQLNTSLVSGLGQHILCYL